MPTIKLTDQFGLDVNAEPAPTSALLQYFQQLPSLRLDALDLGKVGGLTLDQPALKSLSSGISFQDPVTLGDGAPALTIGAGVSGSLRIISDPDSLPLHGDKADGMAGACYMAVALEATASASVSEKIGALTFGASPSTRLELESYCRFAAGGGVTLLDALRQSVAGFSIPATSADLERLAAGQVVRVAVSGKLELSGGADLLAVANPLASASLPAPLPAASVSAGGSVTASVAFDVEADYEIVARKLDSGAVRVGWYRKHGTDVTVRVRASEGISATLGSTDLFSQVVAAISASPQADLQELAAAGVNEDQAEAIQAAVKAAVSRKLEIAVASAWSAGDSDSATFLYEIAPAALTAESRAAVDRALRGDLTGLHGEGPAGVSCVRSIWQNVSKRGVEFDVNLLGILNYRSIAKLTREGKVMYEPASGALVITDRATAERIQSTQVNFGADTQKLRHVLAESFLITAAYRGSGQRLGAPSLRCSHSFFELRSATGASEMARDLRTGVALGLLSAEEAVVPAGVVDFGRTLFTASTEYDDATVGRMFLDENGSAHPRVVYETAGRYAIQFLVQDADADAVRRRPAIDDPLWNRMKEVGQPGIPHLLSGVAAPLMAAIVADYTTIQWWAQAMSETGARLAAMRLWLDRNPGASDDDPAFVQLRQDLTAHLAKVAETTRDEYGQPWGLIATSQVAGSAPAARILISGPRLVREQRRAPANGASGSSQEKV